MKHAQMEKNSSGGGGFQTLQLGKLSDSPEKGTE